jgi:hypothetical protein
VQTAANIAFLSRLPDDKLEVALRAMFGLPTEKAA